MQLHWIHCPVRGNNTRTNISDETVLEKFPLYCPKCRQETLVNIKNLEIIVIKEPDA